MLSFGEYCGRVFRLLEIPHPSEIGPNMDLYEDLDLDSLQALELVILTEQLAGLFVPPPEVPPLFTLGDAYGYYKSGAEQPNSG